MIYLAFFTKYFFFVKNDLTLDMNALSSILVGFTVIIIVSCQTPREGNLKIENVNVVNVRQGRIIESQDVVIQGNKITSISEYQNTVFGGDVIDGTGKYLIPGLWDMHTHIFSTNIDSLSYRMNLSNKLMIANGVTGFREMGYTIEEAAETFREKVRNRDYLPQRFIYTTQALDGDPPVWNWPDVVKAIQNPQQATAAIDSIMSHTKADFIKVYSVLSPESYMTISAYCQKNDIDFAGHFPVNTPLSAIAQSGIKSLEHGFELIPAYSSRADSLVEDGELSGSEYRTMFGDNHEESANDFFELLRENQVWITPTLTINQGLALFSSSDTLEIEDERKKYVDWKEWQGPPPEAHSYYDEVFNLVKKRIKPAHSAGVGILAGTDIGFSNPFVYDGFSLHEELKMLVEAGLTPTEALKTATLNPAIYINATDSLGTVEENKLADLVILNQNPIEDISHTRNIYGVLSNGNYFDSVTLSNLLAEVEEFYNN
ncbi:hypothetical protein DDZ15_12790 [Rhodohalobacter mucosus]|uniref:Amidohydrolase-related domain-containing protein n=1 Tax=Rhodohalobacter mucosus TaxID=2079485 RepID=A0A316TNS5_9BACT|nr:hypothetical protein DDZ15_12790 [Rhodohalobacter mucosus]